MRKKGDEMFRLTRTEKWQDGWFQSLKAGHKLVFLYMIDNCNQAGLIELNAGLFATVIGIKEEQVHAAIEAMQGKVDQKGRWIWIPSFIRNQRNYPLNPSNNSHRSIIKLLEEKKHLFDNNSEYLNYLNSTTESRGSAGASQGYSIVYSSIIPSSLKEIEGFEKTYEAFTQHRKAMRKPMTEYAHQLLLKKLERHPRVAIELLELCIERGWQGYRDNYQDVIDIYERDKKVIQIPKQTENPVGWSDWIKKSFPDKEGVRYLDVPPSVREDFQRSIAC